jgi:hypothetical protein
MRCPGVALFYSENRGNGLDGTPLRAPAAHDGVLYPQLSLEILSRTPLLQAWWLALLLKYKSAIAVTN